MTKQKVAYPVGSGLGECHDPQNWSIYIPQAYGNNSYLEINDKYPGEDHIGVTIKDDDGKETMWVNKALLCDIARKILDRFEPFYECFKCGDDVAICKAKCE